MMENLSQGPLIVEPVTVTCHDCGELYEDHVRMIAKAWNGLNFPALCRPCRSLRIDKLDGLVNKQHHDKRSAQHQAWITHHQHGIPPKFRHESLDTFKVIDGTNNQKVSKLTAWAQAFPKVSPSLATPVASIVLARDINGVGKTHLATSLLLRVIELSTVEREQSPFQFWTVGAFRTRIAASRRYGSKETEDQVYNQLGSVWLMVLDDIGKDRVTGDDVEMYFRLINERYNMGLPLIVTSNVGFEPWHEGDPTLADVMGRAAASRLREMSGGRQYVIDGDDHR